MRRSTLRGCLLQHRGRLTHATLQNYRTSGPPPAGSARNRSIEPSSCGRIDPAISRWPVLLGCHQVSPTCRQVSPKCHQGVAKVPWRAAALRRASPNGLSVAKVSPSVARCRQVSPRNDGFGEIMKINPSKHRIFELERSAAEAAAYKYTYIDIPGYRE